MRAVVRKGQKTWYGRTKKEVIAGAQVLRMRAYLYRATGQGGDKEIAQEYEERALFLEHNAERMADG